MDERKLVKLLGDITLAAACIYALDAVGKFLADYQDTKARVDALEFRDVIQAVGLASQPKPAEDTPTAARRRPVKAKDEPRDAAAGQEN